MKIKYQRPLPFQPHCSYGPTLSPRRKKKRDDGKLGTRYKKQEELVTSVTLETVIPIKEPSKRRRH